VKIKDTKIDRAAIGVYCSFEEADEADREYWRNKTPQERLAALELLRQNAYGYDDPTTSRLQRVLEIVRGE